MCDHVMRRVGPGKIYQPPARERKPWYKRLLRWFVEER